MISNCHSIIDNLAALMIHYGAQHLQYQHPDEWRVDSQLREWSAFVNHLFAMWCRASISTLRVMMSPTYFRAQTVVDGTFYRHMRQRHHIHFSENTLLQPKVGSGILTMITASLGRYAWPFRSAARRDDHQALWHAITAQPVCQFWQPTSCAISLAIKSSGSPEGLAFITTTLVQFW